MPNHAFPLLLREQWSARADEALVGALLQAQAPLLLALALERDVRQRVEPWA